MNVDGRLDRWLPGRLSDLAGTETPDYLDDVLAVSARTRQRPAWSFPGRWLPMAEFVGRPGVALSFPWRPIATALIVTALLVATAVALVGSRPHVPVPFGPAANGRIAYTQDGDIRSVEPDGSDDRLVVGGSADDAVATFSPDGTRLAFVRKDGDADRVMVAHADGSDVVEVSVGRLFQLTAVEWSPDSRSLALAYNDGRPVVAIAEADGSGVRILDLDMAVDSPAWRPPDGRQLVLRGHPVTGVDLFVVNADGSDPYPLRLARSGVFYSYGDLQGPAWSPDGTRIVYHTPEPFAAGTTTLAGSGYGFRLHVVAADGTADRILDASPPDVEETWATWSPDGSRLLFERTRGVEDWIGIVPVDGGGSAVDVGPVVTAGQGIDKLWSPDGRTVLAYYAVSRETLSLDPTSGEASVAPGPTMADPAWQRLAPP